MELRDLKTLHMTNPLGIDQVPYFSWKLASDERNTMQIAYQVVVATDGGEQVWDSGRLESDASSFVTYGGSPLRSRTLYIWTVTVWDNHGNVANASATFETALLEEADWQASWVESPLPQAKRKSTHGRQAPATLFLKRFQIGGSVRRARLYATAHGVYELYLNGKLIDGRKFAPENSSYEWLLYYQTYDLTELLGSGDNSLGMYVGDGWWCGVSCSPKFKGHKAVHAVLFQLEVEYEDGRREILGSDGSVTVGTGPVLSSDLFYGEVYDARLEQGLLDGSIATVPAKVAAYGFETLRAQLGEPVRTVMELPCKEVMHTSKGETVLDFGQCVCGALRMRVSLPEGTHVTLEHSEVLDKDGNFTQNILGGMAEQINEYYAAGGEAVFEPRFTFQGFRYVKVEGIADVHAEDFSVAVYSTVKEDLGTFACSDERINRLYENTRWSQRANMLSIPTDCPQREKAGWAGDIQVYATTSLLNEDTTSLLTRWLSSLAFEQKPCGAVPMVVPMSGVYYTAFAAMGRIFGNEGGIGASAGWSDAAVLVPWQMYQMTGNTSILRAQYDSMKAWCDYVIRAAARKHQRNTGIPREKESYLWNSGYHWGEWLIPSMSKNGYGMDTIRSVMQTRKYIAPIFAYYTISSMAKICEALGEAADAARYADVAAKIEDAFKSWIVAQDGKMPIELMGAYLMPIYFDLVPEQYQESFERHLVELIEQNGYCLDTGFLATPFLFDTLFKIGRADIAFKVFYGEQAPSYLNQLAQGATTIWESWYTYGEDGNPFAVSLNHYAFGCVDDWMFRTFTGIDHDRPGFKSIRVEPRPDASLTWAKRSFESEHGHILSSWKREGGRFKLEVEIPCNTTATIVLPDGTEHSVGSGSYAFSCEDRSAR